MKKENYKLTKNDIDVLTKAEKILSKHDIVLCEELSELIGRVTENEDNSFKFSKEYGSKFWYNEKDDFTLELKRVGETTFEVLRSISLGLFGISEKSQRIIKECTEKIEIHDICGLTTKRYCDTNFYKKHIENNEQ
jgi:hypothetical protein